MLNSLPAEAGLQKEQGAEQAQDLAHSLLMRSPQSLRYRSYLTTGFLAEGCGLYQTFLRPGLTCLRQGLHSAAFTFLTNWD